MSENIEFSLSHDGREWIAQGKSMEVRGCTPEDVENSIKTRLSKEYCPPAQVRISMRFDMNNLPRWLHQYSTHYFNRILTVNLTCETDDSHEQA